VCLGSGSKRQALGALREARALAAAHPQNFISVHVSFPHRSHLPKHSQTHLVNPQQEHLARTAQTKGNGESTLDLVSYVEFQRNFRLAMRAHREALVATRNFWQYLLQQHITFTHLSKSLNAIESAVVKADKVYRTVLERYPYSAKMIKGYARCARLQWRLFCNSGLCNPNGVVMR
jgi:hypothetical protein